MDNKLIERLRTEMHKQFARIAPPDDFPAFHDIPVGRHTSDEFWALEQEHVWPKVWVLAGRAEDIPGPGDYFLFDDLRVPVIVVRGKDSTIRAFYNTCQHRGAPVVRDPVGTVRTLRCQYHSWTYDISSGALINVPDERDFVGLDTSLRCLPTLRCEVWDNWIFVNQDPDAIALIDWIGPIAEQLAELQGQTLRTVATRSEIVACNWKVTAEAFLEVYHFRHIHSRNGETQLDNRGATMGLLPHGSSRMITPFSKSACAAVGMAAWDDWQHVVAPGFTDIATVNDMVRCTSSAYSVFPNLITPIAAYGFPFITFWPIDKRTTRITWTHYAPIDFEPDDGLTPAWQKRMDTFDQIMAEDFANLAPMQRSLESPAMRGMPINYQERRIWHFHEQLDRMIGIDRVPPDLRVAQLLSRYVEG
jgi:phenylpropionate dioxygenase-like ring-hydroxylating dioxygenase large terminal subunit